MVVVVGLIHEGGLRMAVVTPVGGGKRGREREREREGIGWRRPLPPPHMATLATCVSCCMGNARGFHSGRRITSQNIIHPTSHAPMTAFMGNPKSNRASMRSTFCLPGWVFGLRFANKTACTNTFAKYSPPHTIHSWDDEEASLVIVDDMSASNRRFVI